MHVRFSSAGVHIMSQHPSFKAGSSSNKKRRNVLKRFERVTLLRERGDWKDGDRVQGLVKTKPAD
jgi:small basic protein (TIGR04137 family)